MIRVLDQHTIDKIAAGEVIERPASVVKELVENSIDAGATRITVEITDGGTSMIRVTDNGSGIEEEDIRKAYVSHATSKLDNIDDLLSLVSLGFRGEALSTIAAVSKVEMITKTHSSLSGFKYVIHGGKEIEYTETGAPDGTTIITRDIFFNTPARLKFLKTNMTEGAYINDLMSHIALANPEIAIKLISSGKTIVDTRGDGDLKNTIYSLYGKDITKSLLEVDYESGDIKIYGYVGKPFISKGNRSFENYFVNRRYIKSNVVNRAIEEAYKTHIMQHKFPYTALFIEVPPYMVDVNVHPAKREFRFDDEKALFSSVFHAVADALAHKEMIPESEADYRTKGSFYTPEPKPQKVETDMVEERRGFPTSTKVSADFQTVNTTNEKAATYDSDIDKTSADNSTFRNNTNSVNNSSSFKSDKQEKITGDYSILESLLPKEYRDKLFGHTTENLSSADSYEKQSDNVNQLNDVNQSNVDDEKRLEDKNQLEENNQSYIEKKVNSQVFNNTGNKITTNSVDKITYKQEELTEERYLSKEARPKHRIIGLVFDTYWITEYEDSLYLMDQHAAHEKINYETFMEEFRNRQIMSQNIFPPVIETLSSREKLAVMNNLDYFKKTGFEVEDFGGNDVKISAVPANLLGLDSRDVFTEIAAYLADDVTGLTEDIFVRKIASMGCKAAVKGNQKITVQEVETLMDRLMALKDPYTCPHGRPTIIKMTKDELDKKFKRIVE